MPTKTANMMKHHIGAYLAIVVATFLIMVGCMGKSRDTGNGREPQASDTLYTWRATIQLSEKLRVFPSGASSGEGVAATRLLMAATPVPSATALASIKKRQNRKR